MEFGARGIVPPFPLVTPLMQLTYSCKNKVGTWLASENADVSLSFRQIPIKIVESGNAAVCFWIFFSIRGKIQKLSFYGTENNGPLQ